jgi:hypothetical protein
MVLPAPGMPEQKASVFPWFANLGIQLIPGAIGLFLIIFALDDHSDKAPDRSESTIQAPQRHLSWSTLILLLQH